MLYHIYCIWVKTKQGVLRYYGHTENMTVRKGKHVSAHKKWVAAGKPKRVSEVNATRSVFVLDHEDWRMDVVDKIECETKDEARALEGKWILENDCVNMKVEGRTKQEWLEDNPDYNKQYYEDHKEQISEYQKQYRQDNKEEQSEYIKKYREHNKAKIRENLKQYRETHKAEISAKGKEKVTCDICGSLVRKYGIVEHHKSKKCLSAKLSQPITTNADAISSCA